MADLKNQLAQERKKAKGELETQDVNLPIHIFPKDI